MEVPTPSVLQTGGGRRKVIKIMWGKGGVMVSAGSMVDNQKCLHISPAEHHVYCSHSVKKAFDSASETVIAIGLSIQLYNFTDIFWH